MKNYRLRLSKSIPFCSEKFYELLAEAKALGFPAFDFDIASAWSNPELEAEYFLHLEEGMKAVIESGIPVNCIHIPFGTRWNPCTLDEAERIEMVEKFRAIIKRTAPVKPSYPKWRSRSLISLVRVYPIFGFPLPLSCARSLRTCTSPSESARAILVADMVAPLSSGNSFKYCMYSGSRPSVALGIEYPFILPLLVCLFAII